MRKRVAIQPVVDYNENAWDWFVDLVKERIRNDPYSLPYRDVYNSLSEKPRDYITPFCGVATGSPESKSKEDLIGWLVL